MTVWVVRMEDVNDGTKICDSISIFYSLKKAKDYFKERVEFYKADTDNDNIDYIIEENDGSFELWKDGYWCSDHVIITLSKHFVI